MVALKRLTERVAAPFAGCRVDRAAGVIRGMLVCGFESANGRDYPWGKGLTHRKGTYEGKPVNCDHGQAATVDRRLGWLANEHTGEDGRPRADLHVLRSHPMADRVFEAAERNPALFGLSHVAMCRTRRGSGGRDVVESVDEVESVDLVADPATTRGFFESRGSAVKISLRKFAEKVGPKLGPAKWGALTKLCEDFPAAADAPVVDEPVADAEGGGDLKAALMSAITPMLDEAFESGDSTKLIAAIKDFIKLHAKHTGKGGGGGSTEDDAAAAEEARRRTDPAAAIRESIAVCKKVGFKGFDATDLDILGATPAAEREQVARRLMGTAGGGGSGGERVESASRHQTDRFAEERAATDRLRESRQGAGGKVPEPITWQD